MVHDWANAGHRVSPRARGDVCSHRLDGEALLYDPLTCKTLLLNDVALAVWNNCDGNRTTRDLAQSLVASYDVDEETAEDHVCQLLAFFAEADLLEGARVW